jgi:hypothetical protein
MASSDEYGRCAPVATISDPGSSEASRRWLIWTETRIATRSDFTKLDVTGTIALTRFT